MAEAVQAVSKYDSMSSSFCISAAENPVLEKISRVARESIATPNSPKSFGASKRARIIVLMKRSPLLVMRRAKIHIPPWMTFFERGSVVLRL